MSPSLLAQFVARGIRFEVADGRLRYVATATLDQATEHEIRRHKTAVLRELLEAVREQRLGDLPREPRWRPPDAREAYEERAAIIEYDAGVDRVQAEVLAELSIRQRVAEGGLP